MKRKCKDIPKIALCVLSPDMLHNFWLRGVDTKWKECQRKVSHPKRERMLQVSNKIPSCCSKVMPFAVHNVWNRYHVGAPCKVKSNSTSLTSPSIVSLLSSASATLVQTLDSPITKCLSTADNLKRVANGSHHEHCILYSKLHQFHGKLAPSVSAMQLRLQAKQIDMHT